MEMMADILLAAGAFGTAIYCFVLAARLRRLQTLESGMGGAIAVLSAQVDDLTRALDKAHNTAEKQVKTLDDLTTRGNETAGRLELILASMHDLPEPAINSGDATSPEKEAAERRLRFVRRRNISQNMEAAE
ncbi:MAG: hypothetical protein ACK5M4_11690 [Pseudorhodobacter sp.]